ncbi:MAG: hypothetical protein AB1746_09465 [Candidatus Zixiibacteriota bacterium]
MENKLIEMLEHLKYEIDMLYQSTCYLLNVKKIHTEYRHTESRLTFDDTSGDAPFSITPDSKNYDWVCKNAVIESFGLHSRNIIEFLFFPPKSDYLRAQNYFEMSGNKSLIKFKTKKKDFTRLLNKINNDISHLTLNRLGKTIEKMSWDFAENASKIGDALKDFTSLLNNKAVNNIIGDSIDKLLSLASSPMEKA